MSTLRDRFDTRHNSLDILRLSFAVVVAVAHSFAMQTGDQPVWGRSTLGDFAVDGFFILSGFLVTRSYLKLNSPLRFTWHRFLRIMPGFWVCLVVTALVVAPLAALLKGYPISQAFTGDPSALRYIWANSTLLITQYDIAGILATNPTPDVFDGSLWTLIFEAFCYLLIGAIGVTGLLRLRPVLVPIVATATWLLSMGYELGINVGLGDDLIRMVFLFFIGATAHLHAHRIPMSAWIAAGAVMVFIISAAGLENYRTLGAVPLAYALLWFSACFRWPLSLRADLSYGVYIYHWPVLQVMACTALVSRSAAVFVLIGLLTTAGVAAASWFLIEKPALARKHNAVPDQVEKALRRALDHTRRQVKSAGLN